MRERQRLLREQEEKLEEERRQQQLKEEKKQKRRQERKARKAAEAQKLAEETAKANKNAEEAKLQAQAAAAMEIERKKAQEQTEVDPQRVRTADFVILFIATAVFCLRMQFCLWKLTIFATCRQCKSHLGYTEGGCLICRLFDPFATVIAAADESMIQQKYCAAEHQLSWRTRERKTVTFIPLKVGTLSSRRRSPSIGAHWPLCIVYKIVYCCYFRRF